MNKNNTLYGIIVLLLISTGIEFSAKIGFAKEGREESKMVKTEIKSGYFAANGINYYYEIHGEGEPLLLLHGGLGSIEMFEPDLMTLAGNRTVIAVDLQGHGRTELGDCPII